jgi:hypothetical protein
MAATETYTSIGFTCSAFGEALSAATDDTVKAVESAIKSAITKVARSARSLTSAEIRRLYNVPKAVLDERLEVLRTRVQQLEVELVFGGKSISLSYFGARQYAVKKMLSRKGTSLVTKTMKRSRTFQGVSVEIVKGKRTELKSAFLARMKSGHIGVMERTPGKKMKGKNKQAIRERALFSIAAVVSKPEIEAKVVQKIDDDLEATFLHELEYFLGRIQ